MWLDCTTACLTIELRLSLPVSRCWFWIMLFVVTSRGISQLRVFRGGNLGGCRPAHRHRRRQAGRRHLVAQRARKRPKRVRTINVKCILQRNYRYNDIDNTTYQGKPNLWQQKARTVPTLPHKVLSLDHSNIFMWSAAAATFSTACMAILQGRELLSDTSKRWERERETVAAELATTNYLSSLRYSHGNITLLGA